jgi:hypothetical protein
LSRENNNNTEQKKANAFFREQFRGHEGFAKFFKISCPVMSRFLHIVVNYVFSVKTLDLISVFRIRVILVWIRIRIRESIPLTNGSGSNADPNPDADPDPAIYVTDLQDANKKLI